MTDRIEAAIKAIAPRFESANRYPVQKATVPIDEWRELLYAIAAATPAPAQPEGQPGEPVAWKNMTPWMREFLGNGEGYVRTLYNEPHDAISRTDVGSWIQAASDMLRRLHPPKAGAAAPAEGAAQDAARYRRFFEAGLPITFMGIEYEDKASLDAAIDADLAQEGKAL